jgi:hypothetical protein
MIQQYYLITTETCPKCPEFKRYVQENLKDMKGEIISWGLPENEKKYKYLHLFDIKVAPTLCIFTVDLMKGTESERILFDLQTSEISELEDWIEDNLYEISEETKTELEESNKDFEKGEFYTHDQAFNNIS